MEKNNSIGDQAERAARFEYLMDQYLERLATDAEKDELRSMVRSGFSDRFKQRLNETLETELKSNSSEDMSAQSRQEILVNIFDRSAEHNQKKTSGRTYYRIAAGIAAILISVSALYYYSNRTAQSDQPTFAQDSVIVPGGNKAILQLADGSRVELDSAGKSNLPTQGASSIVNAAGQLSYQANNVNSTSSATLYNMVSTPRGGKYQVQLADGSKVWLNSVSSLRYPTAFSGTERIVELTGEAYFEIAKNKEMPFKVRMPSGKEVEVLGTHFNIMAYEEEKVTKTTLLEGSVKVSSGSLVAILSPNQQAQLTSDGNLSLIEDFDVSQAVAWKNDLFVFRDLDLDAIMRQVARWYDVEVTYQDDLRTMQFGGVVSRRESAAAVLNLLELTGVVDFEVNGRNIIVRKVK